MQIYNILNGYNIQKIADTRYDYNIITYNKVDIKITVADDPSLIKRGSIVFCKTDFLETFFDIIKSVQVPIILITHCSDRIVDKNLYSQKPGCVYNWFSQNIDVQMPDLHALPIGTFSFNGFKSKLYTKYYDIFTNLELGDKNNFNGKQKLYCNFDPITNKNRANILATLKSKSFSVSVDRKDFYSYFNELKEYQFIASPPGTGIDCHRTWEALYAGCIPVVEKHFMYDSYNLPIIQIDNWNDLTLDLLVYKFNLLKDKIFSYDQLTTLYWIRKIKSISNLLR